MTHFRAFSLAVLFWSVFALAHGASSHYMETPERYLDSGSGRNSEQARIVAYCQEWAADADIIAEARVIMGWSKEKLLKDLKPASEIGKDVHKRMLEWVDEAYELEGIEALQDWVMDKYNECMGAKT